MATHKRLYTVTRTYNNGMRYVIRNSTHEATNPRAAIWQAKRDDALVGVKADAKTYAAARIAECLPFDVVGRREDAEELER